MTRSRYLFFIGAGWLWFLTALFLVAWLMMWLRAPEAKFAVVGMLSLETSPGEEKLYAILYTAVLLGTSALAWICTKKPWALLRCLTGLGAGSVLAMTLYPSDPQLDVRFSSQLLRILCRGGSYVPGSRSPDCRGHDASPPVPPVSAGGFMRKASHLQDHGALSTVAA